MKHNLPLILLIIIISFTQHGCTVSRSHIALIKQGNTPSIGVVVSVPDEINVDHIGLTVFQNFSNQLPSKTNMESFIHNHVEKLINDSNKVDIVSISNSEHKKLSFRVKRDTKSYTHRHLRKFEIEYFSKWGRDNSIDYMCVFFPYISAPEFARIGNPRGIGIFAGMASIYQFASYKAVLIDTAKSETADISRILTVTVAPPLIKELTQKEIAKVNSDWKYLNDNHDIYSEDVPKLEVMLEEASYYGSHDYKSMKAGDLDEQESELLQLASRNIELNLINLGLVNGTPINSLVDKVKTNKPIRYKPFGF
jgi:hypothetical protein